MKYPAEIRKVIYTTNAIESVNRSLRKISKNRGVFPHSNRCSNCISWPWSGRPKNGRCRSTTGARRSTASPSNLATGCRKRIERHEAGELQTIRPQGARAKARRSPPARSISSRRCRESLQQQKTKQTKPTYTNFFTEPFMKSRMSFKLMTALVVMVLCSQTAPVLRAQSSSPAPASAEAAAPAPAIVTRTVQLSSGVPEILKLRRGNVGDDVIIAFIMNSGQIYHLSASEILYLREQGVSGPSADRHAQRRAERSGHRRAGRAATRRATRPNRTIGGLGEQQPPARARRAPIRARL